MYKYIYIYIRNICNHKKMFPGYYRNDFVATHAIGHSI